MPGRDVRPLDFAGKIWNLSTMATLTARPVSWSGDRSQTRRCFGKEEPIRIATIAGAVAVLLALLGCGEWQNFVLENPTTNAKAYCLAPWILSSWPDEDAQRLHQCIDACEAK